MSNASKKINVFSHYEPQPESNLETQPRPPNKNAEKTEKRPQKMTKNYAPHGNSPRPSPPPTQEGESIMRPLCPGEFLNHSQTPSTLP